MIDVEPERFEDMVAEALDGLPADLGRVMRNVAVTVDHDIGPPGLLFTRTKARIIRPTIAATLSPVRID